MSTPKTGPKTAVILVDPYNDFLHPEGKAHAMIAESLASVGTINHLHKVVAFARKSGIPIFYAMHRQTRAGDYDNWQYPTASNVLVSHGRTFELGSFGAEYFEGLGPDLGAGDVVATEHWNSSGFANTNLDFQLRHHGIEKVIMCGLVANTCLECSARYAVEHGYHVTMLTNATAGFTEAAYKAATELIWPLFANKVTTVEDWIMEEFERENLKA